MKLEISAMWMLAGIALLLVLKYCIFGLDAWDGALHPGRTEPLSLNRYRKPLLGLVGGTS